MLETATADSLLARSIRSNKEAMVRREVSIELSTVAAQPEDSPSSSLVLSVTASRARAAMPVKLPHTPTTASSTWRLVSCSCLRITGRTARHSRMRLVRKIFRHDPEKRLRRNLMHPALAPRERLTSPQCAASFQPAAESRRCRRETCSVRRDRRGATAAPVRCRRRVE